MVESFLQAGIPLAKVDALRGLLEENAFRFTHSSHLADYIPPILMNVNQAIRNELKDKDVSVVFDGTCRLGEALAVVVRYCSKTSFIRQKLVRLSMLSVLSTELSISGSQLLAVMRDRASVKTIIIMYPTVMDIGCFSHTLNNVGERFQVPTLDKFMKYWEQMFKLSPKSRLLWREQTGMSIKTYSPTRWWSKWECMKQLMLLWSDVPSSLHNAKLSKVSPKSCEQLQQLS